MGIKVHNIGNQILTLKFQTPQNREAQNSALGLASEPIEHNRCLLLPKHWFYCVCSQAPVSLSHKESVFSSSVIEASTSHFTFRRKWEGGGERERARAREGNWMSGKLEEDDADLERN
jgi:hypothetical protein